MNFDQIAEWAINYLENHLLQNTALWADLKLVVDDLARWLDAVAVTAAQNGGTTPPVASDPTAAAPDPTTAAATAAPAASQNTPQNRRIPTVTQY